MKVIYYSPHGGAVLGVQEVLTSRDPGYKEQQAAQAAYERQLDRAGTDFEKHEVPDAEAPAAADLQQARIRKGPDGKLRVEVDR